MNKTPDGGGSAFPLSRESDRWCNEGMSLRDWFAGQALVGLLAGGAEPGTSWSVVARGAYNAADAMLKVRNQPTDEKEEAA